MKIGDLVQVIDRCFKEGDRWHPMGAVCGCFFCTTHSNRIGVVVGPAPRNQWHVMFDTGMWRLDDFDVAQGDVKVIREAR